MTNTLSTIRNEGGITLSGKPCVCISGEWRSPLCTHEFAVHVNPTTGEWIQADTIEFGEWNTYTPEEARAYFPHDVIAAVDDLARPKISTPRKR